MSRGSPAPQSVRRHPGAQARPPSKTPE
jgi:hypothetical protein